MIFAFRGRTPVLSDGVYIAETAAVGGDVTIGPDSSVWFGASVRGDEAPIHIGAGSNIQDSASVHCDEGIPCVIGNHVTVGHNAVLHSCRVGDGTMIGMGAIVLSGAVIGQGCVVAAGSVVRSGTVVPDGMLVAGVPAVEKKAVDGETRRANLANAEEYIRLSREYALEHPDF